MGDVIISYEVADGTGTSSSSVALDIGPIAADPVTWGTLSSTNSTVPSTNVPSLLAGFMMSPQIHPTRSPTRLPRG